MRPRCCRRRNIPSPVFRVPLPRPVFPRSFFFKKPRPTSHTLQFMNHEEGFLNSRDAQKLSAQAPSLDHCPSSGDVSRRAAPCRNSEIIE